MALNPKDIAYRAVRVAPGIKATFAVDSSSPDPIGAWLLAHGYPEEPPTQLFRHLIRNGGFVVDVGAHIGTFALAAAAMGCNVLAIEAADYNVELLELAAAHNAFDNLTVIQAAASDHAGSIQFATDHAWGTVAIEASTSDRVVTVAAVRVGEVVRKAGWPRVDVIKIDVEGSEIAALAGMSDLLDSDPAPVLIVESNDVALRAVGGDPDQLRSIFERAGFNTYLIDREVPGRLIEWSMSAVQTETVVDFVAVKPGADVSLSPWYVDGPLAETEVVRRLEMTATQPEWQSRAFVARTIAVGPAWLRANPRLQAVMHTLADDAREEVRSATRVLQ